jgi:hypothetical protein
VGVLSYVSYKTASSDQERRLDRELSLSVQTALKIEITSKREEKPKASWEK